MKQHDVELKNQMEQLHKNGLIEESENIEDDMSEVIGLIGARDEMFARRFLYFSSFEDTIFRMNGVHVSNLFGDSKKIVT